VIDVDAERAATPGCAVGIHLNSAGASLPRQATVDTVVAHLQRESRHGGYEAAQQVEAELLGVREVAGALLGAHPGEIAITGSDTEGWTRAIWGFALCGGFEKGKRILVDRLCYDSHYIGLLRVAEAVEATIDVVPSEPDGTIDLGALELALAFDNVALVAATHVGTHRGLVNPVGEIGFSCRRAGVPFFLDACQSVGQIPVDVGEIGCDVLTATGRKWLRAPRGTGLLYVHNDLARRLRPLGTDGRSSEWIDRTDYRFATGADRFMEFEAPVANILGLGEAISHALDLGVAAIAERVQELAEYLRTSLSTLEGLTVHDGGTVRSGIVTFSIEGTGSDDIARRCGLSGISVWTSQLSAALLDASPLRPEVVVRASPHYFNTHAELDRLADVLSDISTGT
jgi:selenocysteine lyase/cysteine desulfurase